MYIRDAQGNIMATYRFHTVDAIKYLNVEERPLYGSSRLGSYVRREYLHDIQATAHPGPDVVQPMDLNYELTDHLGNVCAVVSGRLLDGNGGGSAKQPELISASEYEPFGSLLPGRNYSSGSYRYLFQGQEHDDEINGSVGTSYAFEYRIHDPRIGRFLSIDPLAFLFPWNSPYAFSENRVLDMVELEGLEAAPTPDKAEAEDPTWGLPNGGEGWTDGSQGDMGDGNTFRSFKGPRPDSGGAPASPSTSIPTAPQSPSSRTAPRNSFGSSSSFSSPSFSGAPPSTGYSRSGFGFADVWSSVENFNRTIKPPDPFDWFAGALEYNMGNILKDRAKYGRVSNPVIVKTPVLNVSTSAKVLRTTGTALRVFGGATAAMSLLDTSARWRSGEIGNGRAALETSLSIVGFMGPVGLGVSIVGSLGVGAYDRYTEKGCIICWDGF